MILVGFIGLCHFFFKEELRRASVQMFLNNVHRIPARRRRNSFGSHGCVYEKVPLSFSSKEKERFML
jgi:hypothetical protein